MSQNFTKNILAALAKIKGSGTFWSSGVNDFVFPGLTMEGVGEIAFPIGESQVKEMIKAARKAPFGKGSETVFDDSVRDTWEIDAARITFGNPQWQKLIDKILKEIKPDLGIEEYEISAHLYKMLIYGEGDFFRTHRDSEKEPRMFGTLVIGLPSKHEGGEFLVRFEDKEQQISFAKPAAEYRVPHIAFYADCEHEVKPVTSGYRVCLTYNLVQKTAKNPLKAIALQEAVDELSGVLKSAENKIDMPKAILLGHQYTPANFGLNSLKLDDRPKAEALIKAAENAGFYAKLGLVTSYQSGELLSDDYDYGYRGGGWYDDDDEDDEELAENGEMGEVYDEYITIDHWAADDTLPALAGLEIEDKDVITNFILNEGEPAEKQAEGYTGNAGMEMQYWYHYGAVFVWAKSTHYDIIETLPLSTRLAWLRYYVSAWNGLDNAERQTAKQIAENSAQRASEYDADKIDFHALPDYFIQADVSGQLTDVEADILAYHFADISAEKWLDLLKHFNPDVFSNIFARVAKEKTAKKAAQLLAVLEKAEKSADAALRPFLLQQTEQLPDYLNGVRLGGKNSKKVSENIVRNAVRLSILRKENTDWITRVVQSLTENPTRMFVNEVLAELLIQPDVEKYPLTKPLLAFCRDYLQTQVDNKPQPPADWSRPVPAASYPQDKAVWAVLAEFMQSPVQQVFLYQKVQADRTRMEETIRRATVDLTMETIRKGSPHTLKLTKTQAAYERELKKWEEDEELLRRVGERV